MGHLAIPGLVQMLAILQLVTLAMVYLINPDARDSFISWLELNPEKLMTGQVWRVFSHVFIPQSFSLLWGLIATMFLMWIGRGLDEAWGAFRVNLYIFGGIASLTIGALIFGYSGGGMWLFPTLLFAFAMFYPNEEIMLFFVLPIKVKWLALFTGAMTLFMFAGNWPHSWPILFANLNFLVTFGPSFIRARVHQSKVSERRERFQSAQTPADSFFHQCVVCKKTELDDPTLDFRVKDDGEEICVNCRDKAELA